MDPDPSVFLWCLNYRNNGMWTLLSDYRDASEAAALAVAVYIAYRGIIRDTHCSDDTIVIETPSIMGAVDVLYLKGHPSLIREVRRVLSTFRSGSVREVFEEIMEIPYPESLRGDPYRAVWAVGDLLRNPEFTPEECVDTLPPYRNNKMGPFSEHQPPPCYGGQLPT